jgi:hypothetical protein
MNAEGWSKVLVVAAGTVVAIGSALQALNELRDYEDIYDESKAKEIAGHAVRFAGSAALPNALHLLELIGDLLRIVTLSRQAIEWARRARATDPAKWSRAVTALIKARNWSIVLIGSLLAVAAGTLDLIHYLREH